MDGLGITVIVAVVSGCHKLLFIGFGVPPLLGEL